MTICSYTNSSLATFNCISSLANLMQSCDSVKMVIYFAYIASWAMIP